MCQIIYVPADKEVNLTHLDQSMTKNKDGFGVMWFEEGELKVFRTMKYKRLKQIVKDLTEFEKVVHLRNTTKGATTLANAHPFPVSSGFMMHNGTIGSILPTNGKSDSRQLAEMLLSADIIDYSGASPLLKHVVGTTINRLVFMDVDGVVTIINEHLGKWEEGIWYSNEYHVCPIETTYQKKYPSNKEVQTVPSKGSNAEKIIVSNHPNSSWYHEDYYGAVLTAWHKNEQLWVTYLFNKAGVQIGSKQHTTRLGVSAYHEQALKERKSGNYSSLPISPAPANNTETSQKVYKVFVYGTLKRGNCNHRLLSNSTFLGKAFTKTKMAMIDNSTGSFPYLIGAHNGGEHVKGEVFLVTEAVLKTLDSLEGIPTHYRRSNVDVNYNDGGADIGIITYLKSSVTPEEMKKPFLIEWTSK